jgi:branched-subunit amino acid aminotransferase/4-amino-4-deoxychorismate lyase
MPIQERYWCNGEILERGQVQLGPDNRGFRYGDGLFETILVRNGKAVGLDLHLSRLEEGMGILGLEPEIHGQSKADWMEMLGIVVGKLLKGQDESGFGRMRLTIYRSAGGNYLPANDAPELLAEIHPLDHDPWILRPPLHLSLAHPYPIVHSPLSAVKSLNALPYILAAKQASAQGLDDAMLRSVRGEIAECTASNVFLVLQNRIVTPWLGSGCLPGTMRARVIGMAQGLGLLVQAIPVQISRLNEASEIFVTNAIQGLQPVGSVSESTYSSKHHPIMSKIRDKLLQEVG